MDSQLIGKTIEKLTRDADKETFRFHLSDGSSITWVALGDCCSHSWVEHISGVVFLFGASVRSVEDTDLGELPPAEPDQYEVISRYSYKITTDKGVCEFELRNSSNGYYGGSLEENVAASDPLPVVITDDL